MSVVQSLSWLQVSPGFFVPPSKPMTPDVVPLLVPEVVDPPVVPVEPAVLATPVVPAVPVPAVVDVALEVVEALGPGVPLLAVVAPCDPWLPPAVVLAEIPVEVPELELAVVGVTQMLFTHV
jgi:hypothetical protein